MIRELRIKNLALIENLTLGFEGGFTVFTGETGAGKSILIGAIGLLLGERASSEMIRSGCDDAEVCGCLEIENFRPKLQRFLKEAGIETDEGCLIIRRNISRAGKNKILVNQIPLPLSSLKSLGDLLIDLHGQHQHQSLLNEEAHVDIVDALPQTYEARSAYAFLYNAFSAAKQELHDAQRAARELADKRDVLEFQFRELSALDPQRGEDETLEQELSLLSTSAQRSECAKEILVLMGSAETDGGGASIPKKLAQIKRHLETLSKYDPSVAPYIGELESVLSTCSDLDLFCSKYIETMGGGPQGRMEEINARLAKIQRLKKKDSCGINELIDKKEQLAKNLSLLNNTDADIEALQKNAEKARNLCVAAASALTAARKSALSEFDREVTRRMELLGFNGGEWKTALTPTAEPAPKGMEEIRFLVRTNPGEPHLPLAKTASGGEVSRLMLAVKSILAEQDEIPVLIFDEIDTGIGGVLAKEVAKALYSLSSTHQVLCISHLHQIASSADHHYLVTKKTIGGRTVTEVVPLGIDARTTEIARMLGGESEITVKHARELLRNRG
ncbi:MAG: DNA repair protein RecN [Chitinispirillales bacterium]|jgi:DNA repair protein RecN (Recombination protein N)|nr:DNA repair protein RecN [Chitinispirillales bacterium]